MATVTLKQHRARQFGGASPFGNLTSLKFNLATNASGAAINADVTAAIASGDVVRLGVLPAGMSLEDASAIIKVALTASVTGKLGFQYVDGVDDSAVPQDDDYFFAAKSFATAARHRADAVVGPVVLPKDAYLILTTGGAANAKASDTTFIISGELTGAQ